LVWIALYGTFWNFHTSLVLILVTFYNFHTNLVMVLGPKLWYEAGISLVFKLVTGARLVVPQVPTRAGTGIRLVLPQVILVW
jgi:hypothetical protein